MVPQRIYIHRLRTFLRYKKDVRLFTIR